MKKTICAAVLSVAMAGGAYAGGVAEPVMEPEVVVAETSASSEGGIIVPLLMILFIATALSGGSQAQHFYHP